MNSTISWITTYSESIDAVGSILLTLVIVIVYILQFDQMKSQSDTLKSQTEAIRAGIRPLIEVNKINAPDSHPSGNADWDNPDYILLEIANLGNEVARDLQIEYRIDISGDWSCEDLEILRNKVSLKNSEEQSIDRQGDGGVIPPSESKALLAPVEFDIRHPDISDEMLRFPAVFKSLNKLSDRELAEGEFNRLRIGFVIHYSNMADEKSQVPLEGIFCIDFDNSMDSFESAYPGINTQQTFDEIFEMGCTE